MHVATTWVLGAVFETSLWEYDTEPCQDGVEPQKHDLQAESENYCLLVESAEFSKQACLQSNDELLLCSRCQQTRTEMFNVKYRL